MRGLTLIFACQIFRDSLGETVATMAVNELGVYPDRGTDRGAFSRYHYGNRSQCIYGRK